MGTLGSGTRESTNSGDGPLKAALGPQVLFTLPRTPLVSHVVKCSPLLHSRHPNILPKYMPSDHGPNPMEPQAKVNPSCQLLSHSDIKIMTRDILQWETLAVKESMQSGDPSVPGRPLGQSCATERLACQ